jgi:hypothetical protein
MFNNKAGVRTLFIPLLGLLLSIGAVAPAGAQGSGSVTTTCTGGWSSLSCFKVYRDGVTDPNVRKVPDVRSEREIAEAAEHDRLWTARCHPVAQHDAYGVKRYVYAASGCEYGRYE